MIRCLLGAVCAWIASLTFADAFAGASFSWLSMGALVAVAVACIALSHTKLSKTVRVAAATAVTVLYVLLTVAPGLSVHNGLFRLLTAALPVEPRGPELAFAVLVSALAGIGAVEPLLRGKPVLLSLLSPLGLALLGSAISAPAGNPPGWLAPAFAASAALLLYLTARPPAAARFTVAPAWLRVTGAAVTVAIIGGIAATAAVAPVFLSGDDPAQARSLLPAPVEPRLDTSPLSLFPAFKAGQRPLSLTVTAATEPSLLRFATLDTFDGTYWTTSARYRWAGRHLAQAAGTVVEEHIQVLRDDGLGWLVSSGRPVFVSTAGLGVDEVTGDLVIPLGQTPPRSVTIRSAVAPAVSADVPPANTSMSCAPDLAEWARLASGGSHDLAALHRLEAHLRDFRRDDRPEAAGGHGLFQIRQLRASRSGTAEQFASAFAVLARCAGFDARVVAGFRPRPVRSGEFAVTNEDVHAWAEVRFANGAWAPFDATPLAVDPSLPGEAEPEPTPSPEPAPTLPPYTGPTGDATPQALPPPSESMPALVRTVVSGLIVILSYLLLVPLLKNVRRFRRRRAGTPQRRVLAAWRDTLDRLTEAAVPANPADTSRDVVARATDRFTAKVTAPLRSLAEIHDEAAYARFTNPALASAAWQSAEEIRTALSAELGRRRLLALLHPRTLLRRG